MSVKSLLMSAAFSYRSKKALPAITPIINHPHAKVKAIGEALHEALSKNLNAGEKTLIEKIENRRKELLQSKEEIAVIDYGAGSSSDHRSQAEMEKGVPSTALVQNVCKASKPANWAVMLFKLVRKLQPESCVELGSCVGISASYQAGALKMNDKGKLHTLEGSPEIAKLAGETLNKLNLMQAEVVAGPFHETLQQVLKSAKPIDYFFNDGHHDYAAVKKYFYQSLPYLADEAVMILDDISWSDGMRKAWEEIIQEENVIASIDLQKIGIIVISKSPAEKVQFSLPL